jgi:hypothetical protein
MALPANMISNQVVIFTPRHSITGELSLRDKRLSDHINERVDSSLFLRNLAVARLDEPGKILHKLANAVIPKAGILLLFEPPQPAVVPTQHFFPHMETVKNDVFLLVDRMEVRGTLLTKGSMDIRRYLVNQTDAFLTITQATVVFGGGYGLVVHQETILVNSQHIRFLGQVQSTTTAPTGSTQPLTPR